MLERLQRVPLYLYMFAISLVIVAIVDLNLFTTALAGLVVATCLVPIFEPSNNRNRDITTTEEPPYPTRKTPSRVPRQTVPSSVPSVTGTPAIKLLDRVTDQSATNGRGFRIPTNGGTFVFDVPDEPAPTPQPATSVLTSPKKESSAAAIARFFNRASLAAPSAEPAPATAKPQEKIPASELELTYMATHAVYLEQHPSFEDTLPKISGQPCKPLDQVEVARWQSVIAACDESMAKVDESLRQCSVDLGLAPMSHPEAASFARETHQMLLWLSADGRELDQTLAQISAAAERELQAVHRETNEVMQRDAYDYMPGPFSSIPRVRGCPTLPSQSIPWQVSAGYRAVGLVPRT